MPHNSPSSRIDTDIDAPTSMLRRYCKWIGDTARVTLSDRSVGAPLGACGGTMG